MSLGRKLARLGAPGPGASGPRSGSDPGPVLEPVDEATRARGERIDRLRAALTGMEARARDRATSSGPPRRVEPRYDALPGALHDTPHGPVHRIDTYLEPHHCHGRAPVREALEADPRSVARLALDPSLEGVDLRGMLLLDTETTGLAGGTGTVPFLIGMAWFEDESLRVQQLFLRRPGEEEPMLRLLAERIAEASCVVSYNGKSFDWPLLRTRFVLHRVPAPALPPHLDLLHCARRLFRKRLGSVRLVEMEAQVLGMHRVDDVDGSQIPAIYLGFLRGGGDEEAARLGGVLDHNAHDLVALAALLARITAHYEEVRAADDPLDHLAYAQVAHRAGDTARAVAFADAAAEGGGDAECTVSALLLGARLARSRGDVLSEETSLLRALEAGVEGGRVAAVHLELAKLYEHRRKDLRRALEHAHRAGEAEAPDAHQRRLARLERRLSRGVTAAAR